MNPAPTYLHHLWDRIPNTCVLQAKDLVTAKHKSISYERYVLFLYEIYL
jgi:hypothetical protein